QASFGGDDPGCVPDSKDHLKCSDGALKAFIKAYQAVIKCHIKQADAAQKGAPADDEACETSGGGKSAKEKLDAALAKLAPLCAGTSVLSNVATLEATLFAPKTTSGSADQQMGDIWCTGSTTIDGAGDDAGSVDTTSKDSEKCADGVAKNLSKLLGAVGKCHVKQADTAFGIKTFDEEACEEHDPIKGKAAHDKYTAADAKLVCPQSCLGGTQRAALGTNYIALLESMNDKFYPCAGPPTCAPIVIGQAIPHTYKLQGEAGNASNKRCTTNSASNRFGPCNADTDCGGTAGACMQLPWVTADGQIMPFSNGTQTTFTVNTADSFPTCEHALCIPCGNANHIPCAGIPGCEVAGNPNGCNPRATQGCCDQAAFVVPTFFVNILG